MGGEGPELVDGGKEVRVEIGAAESQRRAEDVARIVHSTEMEGGSVPPEARADLAEFVAGAAGEAELIRRARERFGLGGGSDPMGR